MKDSIYKKAEEAHYMEGNKFDFLVHKIQEIIQVEEFSVPQPRKKYNIFHLSVSAPTKNSGKPHPHTPPPPQKKKKIKIKKKKSLNDE